MYLCTYSSAHRCNHLTVSSGFGNGCTCWQDLHGGGSKVCLTSALDVRFLRWMMFLELWQNPTKRDIWQNTILSQAAGGSILQNPKARPQPFHRSLHCQSRSALQWNHKIRDAGIWQVTDEIALIRFDAKFQICSQLCWRKRSNLTRRCQPGAYSSHFFTVHNFHQGFGSQSCEALGMASLAGQALMEAMGTVHDSEIYVFTLHALDLALHTFTRGTHT